MPCWFVLLTVLAVVTALPYHLPNPSGLALLLNEEEFEDYLDLWLEFNQRQRTTALRTETRNGGCTIRVNGDLGQPQPVYLHNGDYIMPSGTTGLIHLNPGDQVLLACTGPDRTIQHPNIAASTATATATCVKEDLFSGAGWLNGNGTFGDFTCSNHVYHVAEYTNERCFNDNLVIRVGFTVNNIFYPEYWSCFDQNRFEVLYVWYEQNPQNAVPQTGVTRPSWLDGPFFPGININGLYTQVQQKAKIASYVGKELADKYMTNTHFLSRGHLTAKSDSIFATGQRATFMFINAAPQWQSFNAGNWNTIEQSLRLRIGEARYHTTIYTGTFGVTQLRDQNDILVDIYLYHDENNNPQVPVPLYFYKVVYDARLRRGTAFVSINNPYYTEAEMRALTFCTDRCRGNKDFRWLYDLGWNPDRINIGYSFCCEVDDFRRTVPHLPPFQVDGLLT